MMFGDPGPLESLPVDKHLFSTGMTNIARAERLGFVSMIEELVSGQEIVQLCFGL
jgi:hypothetical protein